MKTYEHVGTQPLDLNKFKLHVEPGDTFSTDLDPEQEKFLLYIGALKIVSDETPDVKVEDEPATAGGAVLTPEQAAQRSTSDSGPEVIAPLPTGFSLPVSQDAPVPMPPVQPSTVETVVTEGEIPQAKSVRTVKK